MNQIKIFENTEFGQVRTVLVNDEPYFVGNDVAEILGYTNTSKALKDHVDTEDKLNNKTLLSLGQRGGWLINESGLYSLVLSSKLPTAKKFKHWVTSEVLPSIRKHGGYIVGQEKMSDAELMVKALQVAQRTLENRNKEIETLKTTNAVQQQQIAEMNPKATYYDLVLQCSDLLSATEIAKDYGKSAKWLNKILSDNKIQFKQRGIWFLYSKYAEQGYTSTKTQSFVDKDSIVHTKTHTYWTQKGRLFIYDFLKKLVYFPVIEQQKERSIIG